MKYKQPKREDHAHNCHTHLPHKDKYLSHKEGGVGVISRRIRGIRRGDVSMGRDGARGTGDRGRIRG